MLLKWTDYCRIYRVINSVVENEGGDPSKSCLFFSAFASYILSAHYGIDAYPKAGLAAYHLGGDNDVLLFGEKQSGSVTGDGDAFHCWVEADGWALDFMAPAFSKLSRDDVDIPARMFQKPLAKMAASLDDLAQAGDYFYHATPHSTSKHMSILASKIGDSDLAEICRLWYVKPPKKIKNRIAIDNQNGEQNDIFLNGEKIVGSW